MKERMSKSSSKILAVFLSLVILLSALAVTAFADDTEYVNGYRIKEYLVDIEVDENDVYNITETITADFQPGMDKHGIIRKIPLSMTLSRADGSSAKVKASVTKVAVSGAEYDVSTEGSYRQIKIGSRDEVLEGEHTFIISYRYDIGGDRLKGADEFYFNVIGNEWDTFIDSVFFSVAMPKPFNDNSLGFSVGKWGSIDYSVVEYVLQDNTIVARVTRGLGPREGVTVRLTLPDGYYARNFLREAARYVKYLLLLLLFLIFKNTRVTNKSQIVPIISFYPPRDLNSLDVGYLRDSLDDKDVVSLLIYLASKGLFRIVDTDDGPEIYPLDEEYDFRDYREKKFYNKIRSLTGKKGYATMDDLEDRFYSTIDYIKDASRKRWDKQILETDPDRIGAVIAGAVIAICAVFFKYATGIVILGTLLGILTICVSLSRSRYVDKMVMIKSEVAGFKQFLTKAEKPRLEALVESDPEYFYNILPYAYALGVTDKYVKQFEGMAIPPSKYYVANDPAPERFNYSHFEKSMKSASSSMKHSSVDWSSSSGGSSSGGGFSGGGVGGGGGSSW